VHAASYSYQIDGNRQVLRRQCQWFAACQKRLVVVARIEWQNIDEKKKDSDER